MKIVTIQQYPMTLPPEVYYGAESYGEVCMGEYTYYGIKGKHVNVNIPYEVYIPLGNIIHIRVEG